jgi:hypothetical protein
MGMIDGQSLISILDNKDPTQGIVVIYKDLGGSNNF